MTTAHVLVANDKALADPDENRAGPVLVAALEELGAIVTMTVVGSSAEAVRDGLVHALAASDVVVTSGGSGMRPGDHVVDETLALGLVEVPGIAEEIRRRGAASTSASLLSRGVAGVVEANDHRCFVVNAPSSRGGARDVAAVLGEVWKHLVRDLGGASRD